MGCSDSAVYAILQPFAESFCRIVTEVAYTTVHPCVDSLLESFCRIVTEVAYTTVHPCVDSLLEPFVRNCYRGCVHDCAPLCRPFVDLFEDPLRNCLRNRYRGCVEPEMSRLFGFRLAYTTVHPCVDSLRNRFVESLQRLRTRLCILVSTL